MSKKSWWWLSLGLLVVALASVNKIWVGEEREMKKEAERVFSESKTQTNDSFCINDFCIRKVDEEWWIEKEGEERIEADKELTEIYFGKMKEMSYDEVVSRNMDNFSEFGIGGDEVILEMADKKIELGAIASDYEGSYFRDDRGDRVYKSKIIFDKGLMADKMYWVKKAEKVLE